MRYRRSTIALTLFAVASGCAPAVKRARLKPPTPIQVPTKPVPPPPISERAAREVPNDPPAPPEVLKRRGRSPARVVTVGKYISVQVNVDGDGNNIVYDAANEPSIAIDPNNPEIMAIGWRQFDAIISDFRQAGVAYSHDGGQSWSPGGQPPPPLSGVLDPGAFRSDPVLAVDEEGNFYYLSATTRDGGIATDLFKSTDGGETWEDPVDACGGDKAWMAIDDRTGESTSGYIYKQWFRDFSCGEDNDFSISTNRGGEWTHIKCMESVSTKGGTLDVGPDGTVFLAFMREAGNDPRFVFNKTIDPESEEETIACAEETVPPTQNCWKPVMEYQSGPNPDGLTGQPWVATDHTDGDCAGSVYILSSARFPDGPTQCGEGEDPLDIMFTRRADSEDPESEPVWGGPVRVNNDPADNGAWQWFGTMSVAPNGRIDAIWNDTRNTGIVNRSQVFYAYSEDCGDSWRGNIPVTPVFDSYVGWPGDNSKLGDYYDMISLDDGAYLAYAATFNREQDVYFLKIPFDCNGNGKPDLTDIASGTSLDCNENGIPDDCEMDCDGIGKPDECDLADGALNCNNNGLLDPCETDCNENEVPDDCEGLTLDPVTAEVNGPDKNRYASFVPGNPGRQMGVRVTFVSLPGYEYAEGRTMWVQQPHPVTESSGSSDTEPEPVFWAATLGCDPFYMDWGGFDVVDVFHAALVPEAHYFIEAIHQGCFLTNEEGFTRLLHITMSEFGDVVGNDCADCPCDPPNEVVDFIDITAVVDKFRNTPCTPGGPGVPRKARADLIHSNATIAPPDQKIDFVDISYCVEAFRGQPSPFPGPPTEPCLGQ